MSKYLIFIIFVLISALGVTIKSCTEIKEDRSRLSANQKVLLAEAEFYKSESNLYVASVERLTLKASELERSNKGLLAVCDDLRIKVKRLKSASTTATQTEYIFKTVLRDSVVIRNNVALDSIKCIAYKDTWLSFDGCTSDNINFDVQIECRDTITQIVHRVPRKLWFIKYGTKAIRQEVISKNPYTQIVYTEYLELY